MQEDAALDTALLELINLAMRLLAGGVVSVLAICLAVIVLVAVRRRRHDPDARSD